MMAWAQNDYKSLEKHKIKSDNTQILENSFPPFQDTQIVPREALLNLEENTSPQKTKLIR